MTDFYFELEFTPETKVLGNLSVLVKNGIWKISELVVLQPGNYRVTAKGREIYGNLKFHNLVLTIIINENQANIPVEWHKLNEIKLDLPKTSITSYFDFDINAKLYNQVNRPYLKTCDIKLFGNNSLNGIISSSTNNGYSKFQLFIKPSGTTSIILTACENYFMSFNLEVLSLKGKLKVAPTFIQSNQENSTNIFKIQVGLYDHSLTYLENKNGVYNVSINLNPQGRLLIPYYNPRVKGVVTLKQVTVLTEGVFYFEALITGQELNTIYLISESNYSVSLPGSSSENEKLVIKKIDLEYANITTVYKPYSVYAMIKDQNDNLWVEECNVVVNSDLKYSGQLSNTSSAALVKLEIFFMETGTALVSIVACNGLSTSFEVVVKDFTVKAKVFKFVVGGI